ncbi:HEPN domain-containing protein [Clostridium gasigenes]|uniref:Uncharacterized protein n=1 Tax=Clostridium gasigenes TaxID=94869 RepID=A0A1H0S218_9CLOT|nr:HEPN domain-containing protein [Clostridium gasigenes]SDP35639.1 hypothetical protein SAMN04488529_104119 [Clostridium gasigenes]
MNRKKEYMGYWYLPENKENEIYGSLVIDDKNNIKLNLCGYFSELTEIFKSNNINIINGFTKCGKKITLANCLSGGISINMPGIPSAEYIPSYVIIGGAYDSLDLCMVTEVEADFTGLDKWLNIDSFEFEINDTDKEYKVYYKLPERRSYSCEKFDFSIGFGGKINEDKLKSVEITQRTYIEFKFNEEVSLIKSLEYINDFSRFLTLCLGEEVNQSNIKLKNGESKDISVFWNRMNEEYISKKKTHEILIPYNLIEDDFGQVIQNWYDVKDRLEPIINYIIDGYEKVFHIPMTFLKIVQAFEAFSRKMRENCKEEAIVYDEKIKYILEAVENTEYKKWLQDTLRYSNEPTLNSRIKDLYTELDFFLKLTGRERKSIANKISLTRNYYTHFDESNKKNAMTSDEIYYSTIIMQLALRVLVMMELGVDRKLIESQIINCESYNLSNFKKYFKRNNQD